MTRIPPDRGYQHQQAFPPPAPVVLTATDTRSSRTILSAITHINDRTVVIRGTGTGFSRRQPHHLRPGNT